MAACVLLSGCHLREYVHNGFKVGPNYARPPAPTAPSWIDSDDPRVRLDPAEDCAWWTVFDDPVLNELIEMAYRQNLDLRQAGARVLEARALRGIAVGNLFPQTQSADITSLQAQISQNLPIPFPQEFDLWTAGFNGSWELDVWGRYRRAVEAADAGFGASVEDYGETLVLLLSDVATRYIEYRAYQQRLAYAKANVELQRSALGMAESRFEQGASSELDVRQARANLLQTESEIPVFEAGAREANNALCVLLAMPPADLATVLGAKPIPTAPPDVALGIPADLLARRPDVRRAEREVAMKSAQLGIATSDLYPSLTLNGYVGYWAEDINDLIRPDSFTGNFNPRFSWNVLNYGRIANNIAAHDARLEGAALKYQQSVLQAAREVENSLVRFLNAQRQAQALEGSVVDAARAVELVRIQFEQGATDFNRVYTVQSFLATQQDQLAVAQANIVLNLVGVYKALGGGWHCFINCPGLPRLSPTPLSARPQGPPPERLPAPPAVGYAPLEPNSESGSAPRVAPPPLLMTGYAPIVFDEDLAGRDETPIAPAAEPATNFPLVAPPVQATPVSAPMAPSEPARPTPTVAAPIRAPTVAAQAPASIPNAALQAVPPATAEASSPGAVPLAAPEPVVQAVVQRRSIAGPPNVRPNASQSIRPPVRPSFP